MIYLIAPDPGSFNSGGNRFNQQILEGFAFLGFPCRRIDFNEFIVYGLSDGNILIFDSLYIHSLEISTLKNTKAKKIFLVHLLPSMLDNQVDQSAEFELLNCFDLIIANSIFTKQYCQNTLGLHRNILVVQPYIEKVIHSAQNRERNKIIHVSNWVPPKQIDLFLNELAMHDLPSNLKIHFYGDHHRSESYFERCNRIYQQHPALKDHVRFMDELPYELMQSEYLNSCLLIDTSAMETYGMSVAEAIVHSVPVISLGNGNTSMLINNTNGLVCSTMKDLVESLIRFYNGGLHFHPMNSQHIITDWQKFSEQLKAILQR